MCPPPPLGCSGPASRRPARAKTPAEATETFTEVTKSVQKPTKKHAGQSQGPLTRQKNRAPVTISGPRTAEVIISNPSEYPGPSDYQRPSKLSGVLRISPSDRQGPLTIRGPPSCQGPSDNQGPSEHQEPSDHQGSSD